MSRIAIVVALVGTVLSSSGCFLWTTASEGDTLRGEAARRDRRLDALEAGLRNEREKLRAEVVRAQQKVGELEQVLERATRVVTQNSADTGLQVQQLSGKVGELEGRLAELQRENQVLREELAQQIAASETKMRDLARKAGVDMPVDSSEVPADAGQHFSLAKQHYDAAEHSKARALFREFVRRYGDDPRVDDALYYQGASYLSEHKPAIALGTFRKVVAEHAKGDALDKALLGMGEAFWQLHACTDARGALKALLQARSRSPLVAEARKKLKTIANAPRGYCTS